MRSRLDSTRFYCVLIVLLTCLEIGKSSSKYEDRNSLRGHTSEESSRDESHVGHGLIDECYLYEINADTIIDVKSIFRPLIYCPPIRQICQNSHTFNSATYCESLTECDASCTTYLDTHCQSEDICGL